LSNNLNKIALGTVQFGSEYGINNKTGILNDAELLNLLLLANKYEIDLLDTAYNYGNSETRIGNILESQNFNFKIISKAPRGVSGKNFDNFFNKSLDRLKINSIYGYLIHDFSDFEKDNELINSLSLLKSKSLVAKIGFSLYYPEQLEELLINNVELDIVQMPYNLADRRFEKYFIELKERNIEVHVRSVFLQGLFFLQSYELSKKLVSFIKFIDGINQLSLATKKSIENISLNFVFQNNLIDKIIIGVDKIEQLRSNLSQLDDCLTDTEFNLINEKLKHIVIPEQLLIPSNWN